MEPSAVLTHLKKIPMFRDLEEEGENALLRLVPHVEAHTYEAGDRLLNESKAPDRTIIILSGRVAVTQRATARDQEPQVLEELGPGNVIGRTSLEVGNFRQVTVKALETTDTLILPFRELIRTYQQSNYLREHLTGPLKPDHLVGLLAKIPLFENLSDRAGELELYSMAQITHEQIFDNGEWLFRQGEISDRLFLILGGRVQLTATDQKGRIHEVDALDSGDVAGETGLLVGDFHDVTAVADGYARVLYILRSEFADLLEARPYLQRRLSVTEEVARRRSLRTFDWLRDDEWAVMLTQRHWTRLFRQTWALALILALLLPAVVALLLRGTMVQLIIAGLLSLPILGLSLGIAWQYINWRDDYFVVTTQRVVHIERVGPFSTQQEETTLTNIEDIYEVQPGLTANLMNYGNLVLQTAGETVEIDMSYVPHPSELRQTISDQIERSRARDVLRTRGQIRDLLSRRLEVRDVRTSAPSEPPGEQETPPQPNVPAILLSSIWDYFFPASWVETEGNAIIWRRYWLPGALHYALPWLGVAAGTVGGIFLLTTFWGTPGFIGWVVAWLVIEAILTGILLWFVEDWRNDYFQLTASHIILVERKPLLLQESRHEARLDRIQNLGFEIPSIFARLSDYGHVQFETAGTQGKFELRYVRHPEAVQSTISNRQYAYRQQRRQAEANRRQQELLTWFTAYDDIHQETAP